MGCDSGALCFIGFEAFKRVPQLSPPTLTYPLRAAPTVASCTEVPARIFTHPYSSSVPLARIRECYAAAPAMRLVWLLASTVSSLVPCVAGIPPGWSVTRGFSIVSGSLPHAEETCDPSSKTWGGINQGYVLTHDGMSGFDGDDSGVLCTDEIDAMQLKFRESERTYNGSQRHMQRRSSYCPLP